MDLAFGEDADHVSGMAGCFFRSARRFGETPFDQIILIVRPLFWLVFNVLRPLFSGSKMGETPLAGVGTVHPNK